MSREELQHLYFEWLCRYSGADHSSESPRESHRSVLRKLFDTEFRYDCKADRDDQRAYDGINLRYSFADQERHDYREVADALDPYPCNLLEMMVALAVRCEAFMDDPQYGDRTGQWFWIMLDSLGLAGMSDAVYNEDIADMILDRFNRNDFHPDGDGGLFYIPGYDRDLRDREIYDQMYLYIQRYYP